MQPIVHIRPRSAKVAAR